MDQENKQSFKFPIHNSGGWRKFDQKEDHSSSRVSVFDHIEASSSRITMFNRLNTTYLTQNWDTLACKSVFDRFGATKRPVNSHSQNLINFEVQREKKANDEIRSSIPSRMKCNFTLDINIEGRSKSKGERLYTKVNHSSITSKLKRNHPCFILQ